MTSARRVLLAVRDPYLAGSLRDALLHTPGMLLAGIIDPTIDRALAGWSSYADILLIGVDELLWLQRIATCNLVAAAAVMRVVVVLDEKRILDLLYQFEGRFDLVFDVEDRRLLAERIDLAVAGYIVLSSSLLADWLSDRRRRELVGELSPSERRILSCVGRAMPNKSIAAETGFAESEVKALVQSTMRKLRIKNRTTVAVFAATLERSDIRRIG
jgi:DNA-binding NarL/FixJ family response regulator